MMFYLFSDWVVLLQTTEMDPSGGRARGRARGRGEETVEAGQTRRPRELGLGPEQGQVMYLLFLATLLCIITSLFSSVGCRDVWLRFIIARPCGFGVERAGTGGGRGWGSGNQLWQSESKLPRSCTIVYRRVYAWAAIIGGCRTTNGKRGTWRKSR